jgi:3',5'-cyclic AMP phosphodiesterase CpdA
MIWLRQILLVVAALTLAVCRLRSGPAQPDAFFFIQMSDPQFGFITPNAGFAQETANFEKAIAAANRLRPAFVVITGDLTHRMGDAAQVAEYRRIAAKLDRSIPLYQVAGNHDVALPLNAASVAAYRATYGPDYYTFDSHGLRGIVLNSSLIKEPASAPATADSQARWLRSAVADARAAGKRTIVFQHHPWFLAAGNEADQYYNLPLGPRRAYLDLFAQHGITHVFAGHYHGNAQGRDGNLEMVTTGPVGKPMRADSSGFRVVFVDRDRITHRYYPLDSVPSAAAALRP